MRESIKNQTEKNRKTRMRIGDSIIKLMEKNELDEIKISKVVSMAKVSRMTFYHYYETKEDALMDYLSELMLLFVREAEEESIDITLGSTEHISYSFEFFARYKDYIIRIERAGCYYILIDGINHFLEKYYGGYFKENIYNLYFYAGALLNVFIRWLKGGQVESPETIAKILKKGLISENV